MSRLVLCWTAGIQKGAGEGSPARLGVRYVGRGGYRFKGGKESPQVSCLPGCGVLREVLAEASDEAGQLGRRRESAGGCFQGLHVTTSLGDHALRLHVL